MENGLKKKVTLNLSKDQRNIILIALYHMGYLVDKEDAQDIRELRSYINAEFIKSGRNNA